MGFILTNYTISFHELAPKCSCIVNIQEKNVKLNKTISFNCHFVQNFHTGSGQIDYLYSNTQIGSGKICFVLITQMAMINISQV